MTDRSKKITELPAASSVIPADLFLVVKDTTSTPNSHKVSAANIFANVAANTTFTGRLTATGNTTLSGPVNIANTLSVGGTLTIAANGAWVGSSSGLKGEVGSKGDKGELGGSGDKGQKGDYGQDGSKGDKGEVGTTGTSGASGSKGDKGDTGTTGSTGAKGDTGTTGASGSKGDKGEAGTNGTNGTNGDKGEAGTTGTTGAKGDKGEAGTTGAKGDTGTGDKGQKGDTVTTTDRLTSGSNTVVLEATGKMSLPTHTSNATIYTTGNIEVANGAINFNLIPTNPHVAPPASNSTVSFVQDGIRVHYDVEFNDGSYITTSDGSNIRIASSNGNIHLWANSGQSAWEFGANGSITFPDLTTQDTASVKGDKGEVGTTGTKGDSGTTGTKGDKGEVGPNVATTKFGYSSGATVTQQTARNQGVTLNALSGEIILYESSMTAGQVHAIACNNNTANAGDIVVCSTYGGSTGTYLPGAYCTLDGMIMFHIRNLESYTTGSESPRIKFIVIKAPTA